MHTRRLCFFGLLTLTACGEAPASLDDGASGVLRSAIVAGQYAGDAYPETGLLFTANSMVCTGTLIAPDVVLTAAHCVTAASQPLFGMLYMEFVHVSSPVPGGRSVSKLVRGGAVHPDYTLDVCANVVPNSSAALWCAELQPLCGGGDVSDTSCMVEAMAQSPTLDALYQSAALFDARDLALVFLETPVEGIEPAVLWRGRSGQLAVGDPMEIVGYGRRTQTQAEDPNNATLRTRVRAESPISALASGEMRVGEAPPQACHGDSGGPAFFRPGDGLLPERRVAGVASRLFHPARECGSGVIYARADADIAWIERTMMQACKDGVRVSCDQGGALAGPRSAPPEPSSEGPQGCAAGASTPLVLVAWALVRKRSRNARPKLPHA